MQLFYDSDLGNDAKKVFFSKDESRHILKVLRKRVHDILHITNGLGVIFEAKLTTVTPKQCIAEIQKTEKQAALPYRLHIVVAPTKMNDRYEWFLEKATEIGVTDITPVICEHSERRHIKPERFERIIQSAMKQSLKAWMPKLHPVVSFREFLDNECDWDVKCIAHCGTSEKRSLKQLAQPRQSVCILIGPEGDFSSEEINEAIKKQFQPIHLGKSRLRTETAAIVACHSVAFINE